MENNWTSDSHCRKKLLFIDHSDFKVWNENHDLEANQITWAQPHIQYYQHKLKQQTLQLCIM